MNEKEINSIIANNITKYLELSNKTQLELAEYMQVSQATVSNWCKGLKMPRMSKIDMICTFFSIERSDLLNESSPANPKKCGVVINVLGRVAAGIPLEAIEDIIDTEEISEEMAKTGEFFGLQINGDSMEPKFSKGDVVIVRKQDDAESGDIVIAMVNGDDATCKRLKKYQKGIGLVSTNPAYEPMYFSNKEIEEKPVRIIGKVVELRAKF